MSVALEPMEVAPGISMLSVRTPTLPPATHTNAYLVGSRECVLVEPASPFADEIERIAAWVQRFVAQGGHLRAILLTHHHADHVGGAHALRSRLGAPLWAHGRTVERLGSALQADRLLEGGESLALEGPTPVTLQAVHTPGHAPGHLCFLAREARALIAGDMVASVGTILVEPRDGDMVEYLASLRAMDELDCAQLLPAHGTPILQARERLQFYVSHRLMREERIHAALTELGKEVAVEDLLPLAYADTPKLAWPLARLSAEAHLIKLAREGRAARRGERWLGL